jgi:hypothetical protein
METNRDAFAEVFMIPPTTTLSPYSWSKIPSHRGYELRQNGELVGTLERPSVWSSIFIAASKVILPDRRLRLLVLFMLYRLGQAEEDAAAVAVAAAAS